MNAFSKIFSISFILGLALGLTACTPPYFQPAHHTSAYECKRLKSQGLISFDQERLCRMGQPYSTVTPITKQ